MLTKTTPTPNPPPPPPHQTHSISTHLSDINIPGLHGPVDDPGDGQSSVHGVDKVGGVHDGDEAMQEIQHGDLHLRGTTHSWLSGGKQGKM